MSLSPARQHRLRIQAEQAAREGGSVRHASGYDLMLLQLAEDRRRLKGIQSTVKKAAIKVELLPKYAAWAEGVLAVAGMMGVAAAPAELPPLHPLALPAKGGEAMVSRAATVPPIYRIEAPTQIIIQTQPGQSAQDIAREVARQLDERERRLKAKARSNYSDQGGYDA